MAYNEHIYIQQMDYTNANGDTVAPTCYDLETTFGFVGMELPFQIGGEAKDLFSQDWVDEDGDDEYVPNVVNIKGYEMTMKLATKGSKNTANAKINALRSYLTGRSMTGSGAPLFKIYSTYTGIGRQSIRFLQIEDAAEWKRTDDYDLLIINVKVKVNDPITDVTYNTTKKRLI